MNHPCVRNGQRAPLRPGPTRLATLSVRPRSAWLDRSALGLSSLCLAHCLAGSLLIAAASSLGGLWSHEVHAAGLALAVPLAAVALWRGARQHGRLAVLLPAAAGIMLMGAAVILGHGTTSEIGTTVCGVLLLAAAHLLNLRWSARQPLRA